MRDKILEEFLKKLRINFGSHLQKIILFGSMARKDSNPESDYDILLVFDQIKKDKGSFIDDLASEMLFEYGKLFSVFALTKRQFKEMKFEPFIMNAQKEGVLL